jgi:hypothetical protein
MNLGLNLVSNTRDPPKNAFAHSGSSCASECRTAPAPAPWPVTSTGYSQWRYHPTPSHFIKSCAVSSCGCSIVRSRKHMSCPGLLYLQKDSCGCPFVLAVGLPLSCPLICGSESKLQNSKTQNSIVRLFRKVTVPILMIGANRDRCNGRFLDIAIDSGAIPASSASRI